ncbi:MAG: ATP-binding protein [Pseudomonadota bacterium]|nr:ATP-binding protein [Pseudomonadota bacterium]
MTIRIFSPLTRRIITVNILPLAILVAGILYLDEYREGLIEAELDALQTQSEIFAGALGEGAIGTRSDGEQFIRPSVAGTMLRPMLTAGHTRARVYKSIGTKITGHKFLKISDTRVLAGGGGKRSVEIQALSPTKNDDFSTRIENWFYRVVFPNMGQKTKNRVASSKNLFALFEKPLIAAALSGKKVKEPVVMLNRRLLLVAAAPIYRFGRTHVFGALLLTSEATKIDLAVRSYRSDILMVFAVVLAGTILLSLYIAGTIGRPVRRLAAAADIVRTGHGSAESIPDFTKRRDEIGDLSGSLREMTVALWQRMEANESFAADVAHEIKNPLTSLRSAVETAARVRDPKKQNALMDIIQEDVIRLDRLISDISDASRLDVELARGKMQRIDLARVLPTLVEVNQVTAQQNGDSSFHLYISLEEGVSRLIIKGLEGRLVQVFQNLISNAQSFTPPGGTIKLSLRKEDTFAAIIVEDQGPGIPSESLNKIFQRFYSERPDRESFGQHSGLGLSISRQIVEAHGGTIHAENIYDIEEKCLGARFVVRLPEIAQ